MEARFRAVGEAAATLLGAAAQERGRGRGTATHEREEREKG